MGIKMIIRNAETHSNIARSQGRSPIVFTTEVSGLQSHSNPSRARQTPAELQQAEEIMATVKAQPHRLGSDAAMLSDTLGRFCMVQWPVRINDRGDDGNEAHRSNMYLAGTRYAMIVHQHRVLIGLGAGSGGSPEGLSCALTEEQLRANCEAARMKRESADGVLRNIIPRAVSAMVRLCVDDVQPFPNDESLSRHCLWALAVHFAIVKLGINAEKSA